MAWHMAEKRYWTYGRVGFRSVSDMHCEEQEVCVEPLQSQQDETEDASSAQEHEAAAPAAFREFYRSRDGLITTFEDAQGHFTSVASSRLCW